MKMPGGQSMDAPKSIPSGGLNTLLKALSTGLTLFFIAAIVLSLAFLVLAGIQWTTSGGDKNKISAARAKITWAIVGLVITLCTYFIINVIGYFFGVNLLNFNYK